MQLLPSPTTEQMEELLLHFRARRSLVEPAGDLEGGLHLCEVGRTGGAREQVLFESNPFLRVQSVAEVLAHELDHLLAHQVDRISAHHVSLTSTTCRSSVARSLDRARCRSTR